MDKNQKIVLGLALLFLLAGVFSVFDYGYNKEGKMRNSMMSQNSNGNKMEVIPIEHATMVLNCGDKVIYTDPVGGASAFAGQPAPDLILITDIHPDHLDIATLQAVARANTNIVAPIAVAEMLPDTIAGTLYVMKNGQKTDKIGLSIEAIPMYNLPEKKDAFHTKGRGNGYVIEAGGKRVYISGDTADIPEMRALKNIDIAFVAMNLPYTMSVESAASGVLAFKPSQVYPYHYRGPNGLSDIGKFKELVNKDNSNTEVILLNWYPKK